MERKEKIRKTYKKPQINQVKLVIEEAVLLACKVAPGNPAAVDKHCTFKDCQSAGS